MRLLLKFSLVYVVVFGIGLGVAGSLFHGQLQRNAREQVLFQAQVMMETALAMRHYTTEQVRPSFSDATQREDEVASIVQELCSKRVVLRTVMERRIAAERAAAEKARAQRSPEPGPTAPAPTPVAAAVREEAAADPFLDLCARKGAGRRSFRPQTVPAYAATEIFGYLAKRHPEFTYKEAALNPTNPRNRAVDWEEDIIKAFRNRPELAAFDGERASPLGLSLFLARPMRAGPSCLECHSVASAAPPEMVALYGTGNGYGWKEKEVVAAQIISVPVAVTVAMADRAFRQVATSVVVVAVVTLVLLNLVLFLTVIRPVSRFAALADEISKGNMDVPEITVRGRDEISVLGEAFNRMRRSLAAAMKLLEP
jgi:HAMP domain-containing protein